ncbi:hypothetical protein JTE90_017626 [Oedothorax gibbosus]|uniref:Carboxylesterase type B domain-containing protein n=1 Tax=Oedothorax gibbosus TaxID=931172 RepID=A0AAV6U450_9ARAC|nr:hypothetical protein JTE90_017626 [Oedothorax gibbosus]
MALPIKAAVLIQAIFAFLCVHQSTAGLVKLGNVTLDTPVGKVRGNSLLLTDNYQDNTASSFYEFLGIPYAKPPVGELRFKPTEQPEPWEGTYDALVMPPACPQYAENQFPWYDTLPGQSEDCLYLNVWAPKEAVIGYNDGDETQKRAVKLYIHGGGWFTGGSSRMGYYEGHGDANDFDITISFYKQFIGLVVVTVNYRLGALGFLSSGTDDAPGNAGTTNEYGDGSDNNIKLADRLAEAVGCGSSIAENPKDTVDCLKGVEASRIVQTLASFSPVFQQPPNVFLPQFGRDHLVPIGDPFEILDGTTNYYDKKDALLAFNRDEGSYLLTVNNPDVFGVFGEKDIGIDDVQAKSMMTKFLENFPQPDDLAEKLLGDLDTEPTVGNRKRVYQVMGHVNTICPIVYFANDLVNDGYSVYVEEKEIDPPYNPWAKWMGTVHFNNVQLDFLRVLPLFKVPLVVNGQSYNLTNEQSELSFYNKILVARFMYNEIEDKNNNAEPLFRKYTSKDRYYSIFYKDTKFKKYSHLGGELCEILKKYFVK